MDNNQTDESYTDTESFDKLKNKKQSCNYTTIKNKVLIFCIVFIIFGILVSPTPMFFKFLTAVSSIATCITILIILNTLIKPVKLKQYIKIECPSCKARIKIYGSKRPINVQCHKCLKNIMFEG